MQRLPAQLVPATQLTTSVATYYTVPNATIAEISGATVTNVTGTAQAVTVYIVPSAGSAGATNTVVTRTVPANASIQLWELVGSAKMPTGATIQAVAGANSSLNLFVGGYTVNP